MAEPNNQNPQTGQNPYQQAYQQTYQQGYSEPTHAQAAPNASGSPDQTAHQSPAQNAYNATNPPKRRIWPWVLLGVCIVAVLSMGACVACTVSNALFNAYSEIGAVHSSNDYPNVNNSADDDMDLDDLLESLNNQGSITSGEYTLEQLESSFGLNQVTPHDNSGGAGIYTVGGGSLTPGLYYLSGDQNTQSTFWIYDQEDNGRYEYDFSVVYVGNYYVRLEAGDLLIWDPGVSGATLKPASPSSFAGNPPYLSGCYRVGIDIPAGTYRITYASSEFNDSGNGAAYVMKDLEFDDDSIIDVAYVIPGSLQTITLTNGQYLELYCAQANLEHK